ncbi:unnamed protein product, partial [Protopolystoma xenopodis]
MGARGNVAESLSCQARMLHCHGSTPSGDVVPSTQLTKARLGFTRNEEGCLMNCLNLKVMLKPNGCRTGFGRRLQ